MSLDSANKAIRFPSKSYIGIISNRQNDELPLGFMTEDGEDKASQKRKESVDNWVKWNSRNIESSTKTYSADNESMIGFRLGRSIRRDSSWGSGNVKWRIEDPRGFELEITSPNMAKIFSTCVIDNGEILNQCIWARLKGDNVLVPVDSELYQTTKLNSERIKSSIKPSSVKRGNKVVLQNGIEGVYYGKYYLLQRDYGAGYAGREHSYICEKARHIVVSSTDNETKQLYDYASFKPAAILDESEEWTVSDAERKLYEIDSTRGTYYSANKIASVGPVILTETPFEEWKRSNFSVITTLEDAKVLMRSYYEHGIGIYYLSDAALAKGEIEYITEYSRSFYGRSSQSVKHSHIKPTDIPWSKMILYRPTYSVPTEAGNTLILKA